MNDLITIIINVYNGEKYIKKCIDSIVNQTYKNLEVLIINDGSTDNTLKICKTYKDKRIRIISTKNQGLSLSRNTGIDSAKGDYLYFIDVDDFIEQDTIEYLYQLCKKYNCAISSCNVLEIIDYNFKEEKKDEIISIIPKKDFLRDVLLYKPKAICIWNKLIKKELFDNLRFENRIINDMAFTHKLILRTDKIVYSNQIKYYYLNRPDSVSKRRASIERLKDTYDVYVERYYYIHNIYPDLVENATVLLHYIVISYLKDRKEFGEYLNKNNAPKLFNRIFTLKYLKCSMKPHEKIKILLFRISPKLTKRLFFFYIKNKKIFLKNYQK